MRGPTRALKSTFPSPTADAARGARPDPATATCGILTGDLPATRSRSDSPARSRHPTHQNPARDRSLLPVSPHARPRASSTSSLRFTLARAGWRRDVVPKHTSPADADGIAATWHSSFHSRHVHGRRCISASGLETPTRSRARPRPGLAWIANPRPGVPRTRSRSPYLANVAQAFTRGGKPPASHRLVFPPRGRPRRLPRRSLLIRYRLAQRCAARRVNPASSRPLSRRRGQSPEVTRASITSSPAAAPRSSRPGAAGPAPAARVLRRPAAPLKPPPATLPSGPPLRPRADPPSSPADSRDFAHGNLDCPRRALVVPVRSCSPCSSTWTASRILDRQGPDHPGTRPHRHAVWLGHGPFTTARAVSDALVEIDGALAIRPRFVDREGRNHVDDVATRGSRRQAARCAAKSCRRAGLAPGRRRVARAGSRRLPRKRGDAGAGGGRSHPARIR